MIIHPATKIGGQARHKDRLASVEHAEDDDFLSIFLYAIAFQFPYL